jgi:hypothetical protein
LAVLAPLAWRADRTRGDRVGVRRSFKRVPPPFRSASGFAAPFARWPVGPASVAASQPFGFSEGGGKKTAKRLSILLTVNRFFPPPEENPPRSALLYESVLVWQNLGGFHRSVGKVSNVCRISAPVPRFHRRRDRLRVAGVRHCPFAHGFGRFVDVDVDGVAVASLPM